MRIISGNYRGKILLTVKGGNTRPTTDRVKENIFNLIQFDIAGGKVLDLFSGSGALGIECLSRGAKCVDFNDNSRDCVAVIEKNLENVKGEYRIYNMDYKAFLYRKRNENYDLILIDAPYKMDIADTMLNTIAKNDILRIGGITVFETDKELIIDNDSYIVTKARKYGITYITIMERIK